MATSNPVNFAATALPQYSDFYATILDGVFTAEECASLIKLAESTGEWHPAGLSAEAEHETVHSNFRNSDRILRIDSEAAEMIYERLKPFVHDILEIAPGGKWECITGKKGRKQGPTWKMVQSVSLSQTRVHEMMAGGVPG